MITMYGLQIQPKTKQYTPILLKTGQSDTTTVQKFAKKPTFMLLGIRNLSCRLGQVFLCNVFPEKKMNICNHSET